MAVKLLDGIEFVATDLDGTLLRNGATTIAPETFEVIERFCETGAYFFGASGRPCSSMDFLFAPVADKMGYVCQNGCLAVWKDEIIYKQTMDHSLALEVCAMAEQTPGCLYLASGAKAAYAPSYEPGFIDYMRGDLGFVVNAVDKISDIPDDILVVSLFVKAEHNEEINQQFSDAFGKDCDVITSGNEWIDVLVKGVNKGRALAAVSEALGVDVANMAAFGDAENDRAMLELVGHPYLMEPHFESMNDLEARCAPCSKVDDELLRLIGAVEPK